MVDRSIVMENLEEGDDTSTSSSGSGEDRGSDDDDSSESSSDDEPDNELGDDVKEEPPKPEKFFKATASTSARPKTRIKLRLSSKITPVTTAAANTAAKKDLIASRNIKLPTIGTKRHRASSGSNAEELNATVVDSDDAGEDDVVAAVLVEGSSVSAPSSRATPSTKSTKRRTATATRSIRLPPIGSPGLLMPSSSGHSFGSNGGSNGGATKNNYVTAASVFDHAMSLAGYTTESRTQHPHRGSSIQRVVGDCFDSNVKLSLHFPELVPVDFLSRSENEETKGLTRLLIKSFETSSSKSEGNNDRDDSATANGIAGGNTQKKRGRRKFSDMIPLSLTIPYPESYLQKRLKYVEEVDARERAIVAFQEAEEEVSMAKELGVAAGEDSSPSRPTIMIPPIPDPPSPPTLKEMKGFPVCEYTDQHPLYTPRGKDEFVAHLDKNCFHVVDGRYFGLETNFIADPNFVGANAAGIAGVNTGGGAGLATSTSGNSGGVPLTLSATFQSLSTGSSFALPKNTGYTSKNESKATSSSTSVSEGRPELPKSNVLIITKNVGPNPTATVSDLKKVMEGGGAISEAIKNCIIRNAVHGSRSGTHGRSFLAPNGETYPDVSKAFAAHAGIKPCQRCKNNKQGVRFARNYSKIQLTLRVRMLFILIFSSSLFVVLPLSAA